MIEELIEDEQTMINAFHAESKTSNDLTDMITLVNLQYPNSVVLQYYIGLYYEKHNQIHEARTQFLKCIKLQAAFSPSYIHYAKLVFAYNIEPEIPVVEQLFEFIFNKPTLDGTGSDPVIDLSMDVRIAMILGNYYLERRQLDKAFYFLNSVYERMEKLERKNPIWWKNISFHLAKYWAFSNMEESYRITWAAIECDSDLTTSPGHAAEIQKSQFELIKTLPIISQYVDNPVSWHPYVNDMYRRRFPKSPTSAFPPLPFDNNRKIRIGYISSDFNCNAVSLFLGAIFRYQTFQVFCYYTNPTSDFMTEQLKSDIEKNGGTWIDACSMTTDILYTIMMTHRLDILVDNNCHAYHGRAELLLTRPAPVIINYLGFPDNCFIPGITHRLTDKYANPAETETTQAVDEKDREINIFLPRSFLCFQLFDKYNKLPPIRSPVKNNHIVIGNMNKISKYHPKILNIWQDIILSNPDVILSIKLNKGETSTNVFKDFPPSQIKYIQYDEDWYNYYDWFNDCHLLIDTWPYCGTATTCSGLIMGLPTITIYDKKRHVGNVSASIYLNMMMDDVLRDKYGREVLGLNEYICKDLNEYYRKILLNINLARFGALSNVKTRLRMREMFQEFMEPTRFVKEYENTLTTLVHSKQVDK